MPEFLARLRAQPLLADGAMGTMLYARGANREQCLEQLVVTQPQWVAAIHHAYVRAGADLITTHTFGANRLRLAYYGLESQVAELNAAAVRLARAVREEPMHEGAGCAFYIAGNVGPVGKRVNWDSPVESAAVADVFGEQISLLAEAGVDLLLFETFSDLAELEVAIATARALCDLPVVASMSYGVDGRNLAGQDAALVTARLVEAGADVIGANCSVGPAQMVETLQVMRRAAPTAMLSVTPNAGLPVVGEDGQISYPIGAEEFATYVTRFLALGARLVGGCCGTTPEYTQAMRSVMGA